MVLSPKFRLICRNLMDLRANVRPYKWRWVRSLRRLKPTSRDHSNVNVRQSLQGSKTAEGEKGDENGQNKLKFSPINKHKLCIRKSVEN